MLVTRRTHYVRRVNLATLLFAGFNPTEACRRAGYKESTAAKKAWKLVQHPDVVAVLAGLERLKGSALPKQSNRKVQG